ncbi:MAG: hypothetical protein IKB34_03610 [Clostridia bacterium]|nr:hypothetical protein [Clostridia bacterium]
MTEKVLASPKSSSRASASSVHLSALFLGISSVIFTAYGLVQGNTLRYTVLHTAEFFLRSVFPTLFPFMLASGLLIRCGAGKLCKRLLSPVFYRVFGISGSLASAFILGAIAGFPIGARAVCELFEKGECSRKEAEAALALCSNPGVGFTVAGVGALMWSDTRIGVMLWLSCLLSTVAVGWITKPRTGIFRAFTEQISIAEEKKSDISAIVAETVTESARSALNICSFMIFFRLASVFLTELITALPFLSVPAVSRMITALLTAILEFSTGCSALSSPELSQSFSAVLSPVRSSVLCGALTAATLAWSGISVHLQTASFALPLRLSMKKYYTSKALTAVCSFMIFWVFSAFFPIFFH